MKEELYTIPELADRYDISPETVRTKLIDNNIKKDGRKLNSKAYYTSTVYKILVKFRYCNICSKHFKIKNGDIYCSDKCRALGKNKIGMLKRKVIREAKEAGNIRMVEIANRPHVAVKNITLESLSFDDPCDRRSRKSKENYTKVMTSSIKELLEEYGDIE